MAKFRQVHLKIWKDPDFQNYPPEGKLLFIYLCTNQSTTESGIYPVTINTIANETSIPLPTVSQLLGIPLPTVDQPLVNSSETVSQPLVNGLKNVYYDLRHQCVWVKNFKRYNSGGKPDLIAASIKNDCVQTKTSTLWQEFIKEYPEYANILSTVGKPLANSTPINVSQVNVTKVNITKVNVTNEFSETLKEMVKVYEQEIGSIATPMIAEKIKDIEQEYDMDVFRAGLKKAVSGNHRNLNYAIEIMKDYKVNGIPSGNGSKPQEKKKVGSDGWEVSL
jgi:DnaD/phage-associated family protein